MDGQPQPLRQGLDTLLGADVGAGYDPVNRCAGEKLSQLASLFQTGIGERGAWLLPGCFAVPYQDEAALGETRFGQARQRSRAPTFVDPARW